MHEFKEGDRVIVSEEDDGYSPAAKIGDKGEILCLDFYDHDNQDNCYLIRLDGNELTSFEPFDYFIFGRRLQYDTPKGEDWI